MRKKNIGAYQVQPGVSILLPSAAATRRLAQALAFRTSPDLWLLSGPLGSGKTTFVRGLLRALGVRQPVTSPTFSLVRTYRPKRLWRLVVHMDAYRLRHQSEIEATGLPEAMADPTVLVLIEWPERLRLRWPAARLRLRFVHAAHGRRVLMSTGSRPAPRRLRARSRPRRSVPVR